MKKKILLTSIFVGFISLYNINKINSDANFVEYIQKMFNIKSDILRVEPKPNDDYIRLDWDFGNSQPYTYKAYKKSNDSDEFQTISMIDLDENKIIKVLNIYPYSLTSKFPTTKSTTFTTWDNKTFTLPTSASLKEWMEKPIEGHPKGYGMGIIEVTPVAQHEFNENPEYYLKDENGWKYDVVVNGLWDGNAQEDLTDESIKIIKEFISDGMGYLIGHDTINGQSSYTDRKSNQLRDFINIKTFVDLDEFSSAIPFIRGNIIEVRKKGLLLNYPYNIGDIGTVLNVPESHSTAQLAFGDVWMSYKDKGGISDANGNGTNNFYLTTWNNVAMIQTGHSKGQATPDEQKLLANTIFYLSQLSTNNYLDDMSGQDINAPENPVILNSSIDIENNKFIFNLEEIDDVGTKYSYYVEATGQNDGEVKTSNIAETEIKSGFKGYSYIIDTNTDTEPDNEVDTSNNTIEFNFNKPTSNKYYLHIKSIDNVGNFSETVHYEIGDTESPTLELTTSNTDITNGEVPVIINSEDNTKVDYILLPNNQKVYSNNFTYSILEDGEYRFRVYDIFGNFTEKTITINNIDKEKPSVVIDKDNTDWTNQGVQININARD